MSNMVMSNIYNYYMTTYAPKKTDARLDSHNHHELKSIYGKILKLNKEAPLYIYDQNRQTASFALALKENTRQLHHAILDATGTKDNCLFQNKTAFSSDESVLSAKYIGNSSSSAPESSPLEIEVYHLASGQANMGMFLPTSGQSLESGNYSFHVKTNYLTYEFQLTVESEDRNFDIQSRLANLLNQANIGLKASVIDGQNDTASLKIESLQTGKSKIDGAPSFLIEDSSVSDEQSIVDFLGIDYISQEGTDAFFSVNGHESTSSSNEFIIDNTYEISLHGISSDTSAPVTVALKNNVESLKDNVYHLINGYNAFLQAADQYKSILSSNRLNHDIQTVAKLYQNELDAVGINITDTGALSVNDDLLSQSAQSENAYDLLSPLKEFSFSLYKKGEDISRDPLNYANKKLVAYKNPGKNFPSPYASSNYSGFLFNYYC